MGFLIDQINKPHNAFLFLGFLVGVWFFDQQTFRALCYWLAALALINSVRYSSTFFLLFLSLHFILVALRSGLLIGFNDSPLWLDIHTFTITLVAFGTVIDFFNGHKFISKRKNVL